MAKAEKKASVRRDTYVQVVYLGQDFIYKYGQGYKSGMDNGMSIEHRAGRRYNNSIKIPSSEGDPTAWVSNLIHELKLFQQGLIEMHSVEKKS